LAWRNCLDSSRNQAFEFFDRTGKPKFSERIWTTKSGIAPNRLIGIFGVRDSVQQIIGNLVGLAESLAKRSPCLRIGAAYQSARNCGSFK
jgi:hypothetical protein